MQLHLKNISWNLIGGAWGGILVLLVTPYYISQIGVNGYGVIGLWMSMQAFMLLLDFGLAATLSREMASIHKARNDPFEIVHVVRTLEVLIWVLGIGLTLLFLIAITQKNVWLAETSALFGLDPWLLLSIMLALAFQFPYVLYFQGLIGLQKHGIANLMQVIGNTLRYGGGALAIYLTSSLTIFFIVQIFISFFITLGARVFVWKSLTPNVPINPKIDVKHLKNLWRFSFGMAITSITAVLVSNIDRFILGSHVSLEEFGKYSIAVTATGILQMAIQPMQRVYFPRYVGALASNNQELIRADYYFSCRTLGAVLLPVAIAGGVFAPMLFSAWLGYSDPEVVFVFRFLLIGISMAAIMWLPASFQQASGVTWIHSLAMGGAVLIGAPILISSVNYLGIRAGPIVWLVHGLIEITFGLWVMHKLFFRRELIKWLSQVVLIPLFISLVFVYFSWNLKPEYLTRINEFIWVGLTILINSIFTLLIVFNWHKFPIFFSNNNLYEKK